MRQGRDAAKLAVKDNPELYEELEKGNSNTSHVLDWFEDEQTISEISWILAYDFEITEVNKCIEDNKDKRKLSISYKTKSF